MSSVGNAIFNNFLFFTILFLIYRLYHNLLNERFFCMLIAVIYILCRIIYSIVILVTSNNLDGRSVFILCIMLPAIISLPFQEYNIIAFNLGIDQYINQIYSVLFPDKKYKI